MERKYMMYEGEEINSIDLLDEVPTDKDNGVKVIVPVKYSDRSSFVMKIKEQLAYFDNVYFNVNIQNPSYDYKRSEYAPSTISNDFIIHRSEHFQWSELGADNSLHMCLDNVYYPLDFDKLGISRINVPVALRFGLSDGLFPTINREAIRYTPEAKATILAKLALVADYFTEKYNETITDTEDLQQVLDYYREQTRYVELEGKKFNIQQLIKHSSITEKEPKMKGVELLSLKRLSKNVNSLFNEYKVKFVYYNNRMSASNNPIRYTSIVGGNKYYIHSETLKGLKKLYIRDIAPNNSHIIKKSHSLKLSIKKEYWDPDGYYQILKLENYPKEQWRQVIKEFQYLRDLYISKIDNIDDIVIPQHWLNARKKKRQYVSAVTGQKKQKAKGEINAKQAEELLRYNYGKNCKFVSNTFKLEDFEKYKGLTIYTSHDDSNKLDSIFKLNRNYQLLTFSPRELKNIEELEIHNLINYEEFMKGKNMVFKRMATSHLIYQLYEKYNRVFSKKSRLKELSMDLFNKLDILYQYMNKHHVHGYRTTTKGYDAIIKVAEDYSLFDMNIYSTYLEVKELLENNSYMNLISYQLNNYNGKDEWMDVMRDILKYHRIRLDYKNYKLNGNPLWIEEKEEINN